jgi:hypothetical protein
MTKESPQQVIIHMKADYEMMTENSQKFITYINQLFSTGKGNALFIELIQDGVIYIFRDFDVFEYVIRPYDRENEQYELFLSNSPLPLEQIMDPLNFPERGYNIEIDLVTQSGSKDELNKRMIQYLESLSPEFEYEMIEDQKIHLKLCSYDTIKIFALHLFYRILDYLNSN